MPSIKSILVLLVGALLIIGGVTMLFFDDRGYNHEVQALNDTSENDEVYNFSELSADAQTAFVRAHRAGANGGTYTVYDETGKPQEFEYLIDAAMDYTIRYQGNYYQLYTTQTGGHGMGFERVISGLLGLIVGLILIGIGFRAGSDERTHYSVLCGVIIGSSSLSREVCGQDRQRFKRSFSPVLSFS